MAKGDSGYRALRVFADTSVLFAAIDGQGRLRARPPGASLTIFQLGQAKVIDLVVSARVLVEARRVVQAKLAGTLPSLDAFVALSARSVPDAPLECVAAAEECVRDLTDAPILATAAAGECRFLVTLNRRHFPQDYNGVTVIEPGELVSVIRRILLGLQQV